MMALFEILTLVIGKIILYIFIVVGFVEFSFRIYSWFVKTFLVEEVSRKDFMPKEYAIYSKWFMDWGKPMHSYLPIGFRFFNNDNSLPTVKNNYMGYRCDEFTPPSEDEFRIVLLGGSAAWGCGASSNDTTIAGYLEKLFNSDRQLLKRYKRAKCFNLAQMNSFQTQDILTIVFYVSKIRPDIVISLSGWNELIANGPIEECYLKNYGVFPIVEMLGWEPLQAGNVAFRSLIDAFCVHGAKKSVFIKWIARNLRSTRVVNSREIVDRVKIGTPLFIKNLLLIQELGKAFGYKHYQFLQPHIYRKLNLSPEEQKIIEMYDIYRPIHGGINSGDYLRTFDIYAGVMEASQSETSLGIVENLLDTFRDEVESMFYSLVHVKDKGYQMLAEKIYKKIVEAELK